MPCFRCSLRGTGFPGELIRKKGSVGFHTTRWVQAENEVDAELKAIDLLRSERTFQWGGPRDKVASAKVFVVKVAEVRNVPKKQGGATWFEE